MDLNVYRASIAERERTANLLELMPESGKHALDIGARDGHFSRLIAVRFDQVTALDLIRPTFTHPNVQCVAGNASNMPFLNESFDFVFCAEVLEHIPPELLNNVCEEIERVACRSILIGVPYKQDLRVGRTTCQSCGAVNPPWGHVNTFDETRMGKLFGRCTVESISFVGKNNSRTNFLSTALMDFAGNPYGSYDQEEPCIHCGNKLRLPPERSLSQRLATRLAATAQKASNIVAKPHGNWMHALLRKR